MSFLRRKIDPRRAIYLSLVGKIESGLREAYAKRFEQGALNKTKLAERLGCDKSLLSRRLNGASNMTISTLADMVWGLGYCVDVNIFDPSESQGRNDLIFDAAHVPASKPSNIAVLRAGAWDVAHTAPSTGSLQGKQLVSA